MIQLPRLRLPIGVAPKIDSRFAGGLVACFAPGIGLQDRVKTDGAAWTAALGPTPGQLGIGNATNAAGTFLTRSRAIALSASRDYTCLFVCNNVGFAGGNPGVWRSASLNDFCIFQGSTGLPWMRVNGVDPLKPASGFAITAGRSHTFAFRLRTAVESTFFCDGALRHSATHSTNNAAISFTDVGYQSVSTEALTAGYALVVFWDKALSDGVLNLLTGNPSRLFEGYGIDVKGAAAGGTFKPAWARQSNRFIGGGFYA